MNKKEWFDPEVNELGVEDTECYNPTPTPTPTCWDKKYCTFS